MQAWHGWKQGYVGAAWLNGELSTSELHEHLTEPEALRALRDLYVEELMIRWAEIEWYSVWDWHWSGWFSEPAPVQAYWSSWKTPSIEP